MVAMLVFASFVAAADVVIEPTEPTDDDDLYCYVDGQETISRVFYFTKSGDNEPTLSVESTSITLDSDYTSPGDVWLCAVYDQAGYDSPQYVGGTSVVIAEEDTEPTSNSAPYYTNADIEVEAGQSARFTVKEVSTMEYIFWYAWLNDDNVYVTDIDGDELNYELEGESELGEATMMISTITEDVSYYWNTDESMIGEYQDSLFIWDSEGNTNIAEINIVITEPTDVEVDTEPEMDRLADVTIYEGETVNVEVNAWDDDGDELTYTFTSTDFDWEATDYSVEDNVFNWVTEEGDSVQMEYHIGVHVEDDDGNYVRGDFKITVLEAVEECTLGIEAYDVTVTEGDLAEADFWAYDTVTGNDYANMVYLTFTSPLDSLGQWQTTVGDAGTYTVTVGATDGTCSDSDDFKLTVIEYVEENVAPEVEEIADIEVDEGETATIEVIATDANGDELTYEFDFEYGSSEDNVWTWETDYDSAGKYYMTVTVSDGEYSIVQEVIVKINDVWQEPTGTGNYQGNKLYIEEVTVLNANELVSEYCFDANVEATGDYYYENGCLKSSVEDSVMLVYIELLNKNSFKSRDIELAFLFAGEDYYSTYEVLDTGETGVATYRIDVPQNLETGTYTLEVLIGNEYVDAHKAINVDVVSLGDAVEYQESCIEGLWNQIWNYFQSIF